MIGRTLVTRLDSSGWLKTGVSQQNEQYLPLQAALNPKIGKQVTFPVREGELTLDEYAAHPNHRVQAVLRIHEAKIVYQNYPGMNPTDMHVWMSPGKSTVGLIMAQIEAEGKIDMQKEVADYVPELKGTNWDGIKMIDAVNMATALQLEETLEAIIDPGSIIVRFFGAEFGFPNPATGKAAFEPVVSAEVLKRIPTAGSPAASRAGAKYQGLSEEFGEPPMANSFQFDAVFEDGALWKHGNLGQGIYMDPMRDFVGVYYSTNGYIPPYGEDKMPGYLRRSIDDHIRFSSKP